MQVMTSQDLQNRIAERSRVVPYCATVEAVADIIEDVRKRGDRALVDNAARYDGVRLEISQIEVPHAEVEASKKLIPCSLSRAIDYASARVLDFHRAMKPSDHTYVALDGTRHVRKVEPLLMAGIYAPKGRQGYPSSVIMCACAARTAGVREIILCTPPDSLGRAAPSVLYAAKVCGVSRVFLAGGAAAIASMAFGTETVPRVDKIAGPGNTHVTQAKRLLFGVVGVDAIAGPSEVAILADGSADARLVADDLLAQAEHGSNSWAYLLTDSPALLEEVRAQVLRVETLRVEMLPEEALSADGLCAGAMSAPVPRVEAAGKVAGLVVSDLAEGARLVSALAPEHLEILVREPSQVLPQIRNCGAVFVGPHACAPLGDYALGPNHVLPTAGAGRFSSGLSAADFIRYVTVSEMPGPPCGELVEACREIALAEGYPGHARAVEARVRPAGESCVPGDARGARG
jgi:histidinol dehydrogenase